ncbi:MAG: M23 family metallopeptidase [Fibromonadaceae bacterium]|nr:M23 family metallopeptidase [Fibromonadaceae bacterium]
MLSGLDIKIPCILFASILAVAASPYLPLGRTAYLTSSFGEDRGSRYHAGIDFSTDMEEGWPVIAPSNGVVEFAARGAFGYGRHIKFKANDDHIWVFAHLAEFNPKIDSLIRREMQKKEKPNVQIPLKIKFKKGDTLAYSGSTGIGNPHLHIERRTPNGKVALNPCKKMACTDTIAPFILAAAPFDTGFAVKIVDYSREPLENPMSIYSLEVYQGKKLIFKKKYDSLPFAPKDMAKIKDDLLRVEDSDSIGDWHFINAKLTKGNRNIKVVARDFANNVSSKELTLSQDYLKLKVKDSVEIFLDTVPPAFGEIYIKPDFAGKLQCRIPVLDSLSGLDFNSVDFRDKNGKWVIFDYDSDPKELVIEARDFNFEEPLNVKLCDKARNCTERVLLLPQRQP